MAARTFWPNHAIMSHRNPIPWTKEPRFLRNHSGEIYRFGGSQALSRDARIERISCWPVESGRRMGGKSCGMTGRLGLSGRPGRVELVDDEFLEPGGSARGFQGDWCWGSDEGRAGAESATRPWLPKTSTEPRSIRIWRVTGRLRRVAGQRGSRRRRPGGAPIRSGLQHRRR